MSPRPARLPDVSVRSALRSRRTFVCAAVVGVAGVAALVTTLAAGGSDGAATAPSTSAATTSTSTTTTVSPVPRAVAARPAGAAVADTGAGEAPDTTTAPTTAAPTTAPPTTVARQRTVPVPPPLDERAPEPVIELGRLAIPAIGLDAPMYEGIRLTTLDRGPGHWPGSAMPGDPGNVVVGGHRTSKHAAFRHVDRLVAGDEIVFTGTDGAQHVYVVDRVEILPPDSLWIVDPTDTPQATLFACHPPGSTRERIIVFSDFRETIPAP